MTGITAWGAATTPGLRAASEELAVRAAGGIDQPAPDRRRAGRAIALEKGATYVFDKGYTDYRWWSQIINTGAVFVTRRKRNAQCRDIREQPAAGDAILADRRLKIGHRH